MTTSDPDTHPTPAESSSTSSSPVMVDNNSSNNNNMSNESTLLLSDDGDLISSDEDDPLLVLSSSPPPQPSVLWQENVSEKKISNEAATETTTPSSEKTVFTILKKMLEQYQTWFAAERYRILNAQPMSSSSSFSSSSSLLFGKYKDVLSFYVKFIASPSNQDKILKFLQYTFYMVSQMLMQMHVHKQKRNQPPYSHAVTTQGARHHQQWLEKLYHEFTWARYILRILQWPVAMDAVLHQSWTLQAKTTTSVNGGSHDGDDHSTQRQKMYNWFGRVLTYSMVFYYPTELMAYLLWMKPPKASDSELPKSLPPMTTTTTTTTTLVCDNSRGYRVSYLYNCDAALRDPQHPDSWSGSSTKFSFLSRWLSSWLAPSIGGLPPETWSYVSCRCWLIYVITELIQSYVQYKELVQLPHPTSSSIIHRNEKQQILLQSLRNLLFVIPCTTWSMPKWDTHPIVSLRTVNTLLWLESIVSLYQAIVVQRNKDQLQEQPVEQSV